MKEYCVKISGELLVNAYDEDDAKNKAYLFIVKGCRPMLTAIPTGVNYDESLHDNNNNNGH